MARPTVTFPGLARATCRRRVARRPLPGNGGKCPYDVGTGRRIGRTSDAAASLSAVGSSLSPAVPSTDRIRPTRLRRQGLDARVSGARRLATALTVASTNVQFTAHTHTHTHTFSGPFSGTTRVSRYQRGKTNLDFTDARDSEWQWHQLGHMQVCTSLLTDNHTSTPPLSFYRPDAFPAAQPTASKH